MSPISIYKNVPLITGKSVGDLFIIFDQRNATKRNIIYALKSEVFKNPELLRKHAFVSEGTHFKLRTVIFNRPFAKLRRPPFEASSALMYYEQCDTFISHYYSVVTVGFSIQTKSYIDYTTNKEMLWIM